MRLLAIAAVLAGRLAASEPIPVLTVTYGGDGPAPAGAVGGWWREAVDEAAAWFAPGLDGADAAAACRGLRLVGVGMAGGQSGPTPWAAGWWQDAPPALAGALRAAAAGWPGYAVTERAGGLHLGAPGVVVAGEDPPPAGWRVTVHGAGVRATIAELVPADELAPWLGLLAAATRQDLVAAVAPGGRAWLAGGLPARWFVPPDPQLVARLPASLARAAVGIDGAALAADLGGLGEPLPEELGEFLAAVGADAPGLAHGLSGTWAVAVTGPGQGLACLPRSPALDRLIARACGVAIPDDGVAVAVDEVSVARDARCWLVADRPEAIRAFLAAAPPPAPPAAPGLVGWVEIEEAAALVLGRIPDGTLAQWPLPRRLLGWPEPTMALAERLGLPVPSRGWTTAVGGLAGAGRHRVELHLDGEGVRADLHGPLLPWLPPGAALRWFADHAQDLAGRAHLRRQIDAWRAEGIGALPDDLVALAPALPPERVAEAIVRFRALAGGPTPPAVEDPGHRARREFIPLARPAPAPWLERLDGLAAASAVLDGPDHPGGSAASVRHAESTGTLGPAMDRPHVRAAQRLARAGRSLALFGDPAGTVLADRALRLLGEPLSLLEETARIGVRALRDDAWLVSAIVGAVPPGRIAAWAAEPLPTADPAAWRGERLLVAWGAAAWLDLPTAAHTDEVLDLIVAPAVWQPHVLRAHAAADHAALARLLRSWETGGGIPAGWEPPRSPLAAHALPALAAARDTAARSAARHALIRLAWRLHQLAAAGSAPADAAAATAVVGPLTVPWGGIDLPLVYARHGSGFRLGIDASGPRPPSVGEAEWRRLGTPRHTPLAVRLQLLPSLIVISPSPGRAPPPGP